jgi:S-adenosylmethionine:tRNA ribosyltransferase-isomerase
MYLCPMFIKPKIAIKDFDYALPAAQIAYTPASNRSDSKLLVWDKTIIGESKYANIASFLPPNATLIFNNSKVIAARILFEKINDQAENKKSLIEIFCLEPTEKYTPVLLAMQATNKVEWVCLIGGAKKWKEDVLLKEVIINNTAIIISARKIKQVDGKFVIEFSWNDAAFNFSEILNSIGNIPLPPYIQRKANEEDKDRYQTTYAIEEGSVAAPTAGLHFDDPIFESLDQKNIQQKYLTLHVGAGTFMPVKSETIDAHEMHAEFIEVDVSFINYLLANINLVDNPIIVVGTTSLRTIESLYWIGVKAFVFEKHHNKTIALSELQLGQWDAYELSEQPVLVNDALNALITVLGKHNATKLVTKTQLMVTPGYKFKICDALITNFHQPKSTLLLIIAAITGDDWRNVYSHALQNDYRFLSYGDGSLFWIRHR